MFELLVNLILTSLFLQSQINQQATIDNLVVSEYQLPRSEVKSLQQSAPQKNTDSESVGVEVSAQSTVVADAQTGKILYSKDHKQIRSIASITKLMTALVFLDHNPGWNSEVEILSSDYRDGGIVYLIAGEVVSVQDIFYASLIPSSNEAIVALARSTGLSEDDFIFEMNEKAKVLGMRDTVFTDVTGLSSGNKSTAASIIVLARTAFEEPNIAKAISTDKYSIEIINKSKFRSVKSTNKILNQEFGIGDDIYRVEMGKTGYLESAGYCLVSKITNSSGQEIYTVVLGSSTITNRFSDTKSLAYWVFNNYNW